MKTDPIDSFTQQFSSPQSVSKADLRDFFRFRDPNLTEQAFRRILYGLEKQNLITPTGRGTFLCQPRLLPQFTQKKKFLPALSSWIQKVNAEIKETFPYLDYLLWETQVLHALMLHQPGQNQIILETEKDTEEAVFNHFSSLYPGQIFLAPDRTMLERYVMQQPETILVSKLISQTPMGKKIGGVPYAKLEKILVDLLVDEETYFIYQGQELVNIFENAFAQYWIDERSLLRYAGRRNAIAKLQLFISTQTHIELEYFHKDAK
jgi:hypothetical protein